MYLYQLKNKNELNEIKEKPFKLEKELQEVCEKNIELFFGLKFIRSEFSIGNYRIDTLAFNIQSNSFVIIEFKKDRNYSVIDQGYAYLALMLNNKADFILEYNENCNKNLKRDDIDWSQSKVIFVSTFFTSYQRDSINFKDLPIELWEVKRYENEIIYFNQIKSSNTSETIKTISKNNNNIETVNKEIKVYSESDHTNDRPEEIIELYERFKNAVLNINDNISINPTKVYIGFIYNKKNIVDICILKKAIKMWLNVKSGELNDPKNISRDVSAIGHWGNGDYEIKISDDENFEYIVSLIKDVYNKIVK